MLRAKKVGLLVKIALLILLAYLIITLVNVRQQIGDAHAAIETLTEQVNDQTQANTELSNAIENRNDPSYLEDVLHCRLRDFPFFSPTVSVLFTTRRILTIYGNQCRRSPGRNHQKHHQIRCVRHLARRAVRFGPHL